MPRFRRGKPKYMMNYLKEVQGEMKHVSWPTRQQTIVYTVLVIGVSIATALYLGLWDYIFSEIIKKII